MSGPEVHHHRFSLGRAGSGPSGAPVGVLVLLLLLLLLLLRPSVSRSPFGSLHPVADPVAAREKLFAFAESLIRE